MLGNQKINSKYEYGVIYDPNASVSASSSNFETDSLKINNRQDDKRRSISKCNNRAKKSKIRSNSSGELGRFLKIKTISGQDLLI